MKIATLILIAVSSMLLAGAETAATNQNQKNNETVEAGTKPHVRKKNLSEEEIKIQELLYQRNELIRKIHQKRVDLLKNNPKLRRMYLQLLKQTRELAMELDSNREMRMMNDALNEINRKLEQEQKK